jgi:succinyl-CoA:acetate CoA-transferase
MSYHQFIKSKLMTAADVAAQLPVKGTLATSGFTIGYPKAIPAAYAARIAEQQGQEFSFNLYTGASTGEALDGVLARTGAMKKRLPFQSTPELRDRINRGEIEFLDIHLSHVALYIEHGILDPIDVAIVEAIDVTADGRLYLTASAGMSPTFVQYAKEVYIELNQSYPLDLKGYHDIYVPELPPFGRPIHITNVADRIGVPYVKCPVDKIRGIVLTDTPDYAHEFKKPDAVCTAIAEHVLEFLCAEVKKGRMPADFLPFQSGVGNIANAVLSCLAHDKRFKQIQMYTEVVQDSLFDLLDADKLECASTSALTFSQQGYARFYEQINELRQKIILRPQEISNHPEVIRRLGIIAMNTALEVDIYGNVNSTHVLGSKMMNGIGGSGDFTRNAYLSIFMAPATAKQGTISTFVPMVSHVDHNEHSTQIIVSEYGLADLRGLCPRRRAEQIINNCVAPRYRELMREYLATAQRHSFGLHTPHDLRHVFDWHLRMQNTGSMQP